MAKVKGNKTLDKVSTILARLSDLQLIFGPTRFSDELTSNQAVRKRKGSVFNNKLRWPDGRVVQGARLCAYRHSAIRVSIPGAGTAKKWLELLCEWRFH